MTTSQTEPLVSSAQAYREKIFNRLGDRNPGGVGANVVYISRHCGQAFDFRITRPAI